MERRFGHTIVALGVLVLALGGAVPFAAQGHSSLENNQLPACTFDEESAALTIDGGWIYTSVADWGGGHHESKVSPELLEPGCPVTSEPSGYLDKMRVVNARPRTGRAEVIVQPDQVTRDMLWNMQTPLGVERPNLTLDLRLPGRPDGSPWSVRAVGSGLDIDSDGVPEFNFDQPQQWRYRITVVKGRANYDLRAATTSPYWYSLVNLGSKSATTDANDGGTVIGPDNGSDLVVWGSPAQDRIVTGGGDDVIAAFGGNDIITTGAGNDTVSAGWGSDIVTTGDGNDLVNADRGIDLRIGEMSTERLPGHDVVRTGSGTSYVETYGGGDVIVGGPGTDIVTVQEGRAGSFALGAGRDLIDIVSGSVRRIDCGPGAFDTIQYSRGYTRPPVSNRCEAVGHFNLMMRAVFPYGVWVDNNRDVRWGWPCGMRAACPLRRDLTP